MYLTEYDEIILSPLHISIVFKIYADRCGYILKKALRSFYVSKPCVITVDKIPAYPIAIEKLKKRKKHT